MKGRHTANLFLLAQECLLSMNRSKNKEGWLVLNIDIKKTFDTISWTFINHMLNAYNMPTQQI